MSNIYSIPKDVLTCESELETKLKLAQMVGDKKTIARVSSRLYCVYASIENRQSGGIEL